MSNNQHNIDLQTLYRSEKAGRHQPMPQSEPVAAGKSVKSNSWRVVAPDGSTSNFGEKPKPEAASNGSSGKPKLDGSSMSNMNGKPKSSGLSLSVKSKQAMEKINAVAPKESDKPLASQERLAVDLSILEDEGKKIPKKIVDMGVVAVGGSSALMQRHIAQPMAETDLKKMFQADSICMVGQPSTSRTSI